MSRLFDSLKKNRFVIAGPCVIENEEMILRTAAALKKICAQLNLVFIFKASFDKANRTSVKSFRGPGIEKGLTILDKVKKKLSVPIITDIHEANQAQRVAEVADIIQIPAFLCRQTDLLVAAGKTGKIVNIKKAQFLSGTDMIHPVKKILSTGNNQLLLTERGNMYGYNNLVVDFRNLADMKKMGFPVIMDVTHSLQKPGGLGHKSGGNREYAPLISKAAVAVGVNGLFFEVHPEPEKAMSDAENQLPLSQFKNILSQSGITGDKK
jgi:2-dehydro-3-deoxyphosphooctonate aldolase (KDO 8-P synthase)